MSDLKQALLDAKYIDMVSLADFVVRDCGLPDADEDGNLLPQANEIAAALFRWAAGAEAMPAPEPATEAGDEKNDDAEEATDADEADIDEYDENGDPVLSVEEAEQREAELKAQAEETS
ncbi:hypothetical protein J7443_04440 [Tropicibacter sp. R15_0]|uniref:hypothetical protein n=1 Tax=Tropicibacter sp. R15_0 TaxID=2821101 RepID=UPI001ADA410F|nr:hypothetical protein [Tropicibacter sp. R15_0]MBO9464470.1 hypothetical protein [Tropicibacter sp. R15_0]